MRCMFECRGPATQNNHFFLWDELAVHVTTFSGIFSKWCPHSVFPRAIPELRATISSALIDPPPPRWTCRGHAHSQCCASEPAHHRLHLQIR